MRLLGNSANGLQRIERVGGHRHGPVRASLSERSKRRVYSLSVKAVPDAEPPTPAPLWLDALSATVQSDGVDSVGKVVRWHCVSGRAFYTNVGAEIEMIQPLGVRLEGGHTLSVWWLPGATSYSLAVYGGAEPRA